jgi:sugar phosphate isomerase/epimerase
MKLSCLPVSLYNDLSSGALTLADWFTLAGRLGLDGADLSVAHLASRKEAELYALRRQAEAAGVEIVMLVTYSDFTQPDAGERRRQVEDLKQNIKTAAHLGASFLRVTAGQAHPGVSEAEGIAWAVEGLTAGLAEAAQAGVTLAYENHTIGYGWRHYDFSRPAGIFLEIVARTEGTGLGLLYDTANTLAHGDDPLAVLAQVKERVKVLHINDIRQEGLFEPVVAGTGVAPLEAILREMRQAGFDGWISLEEASRTGESAFWQAVPYIDRLWQQVGGSPRQRFLNGS